jgi:hypothetical protein
MLQFFNLRNYDSNSKSDSDHGLDYGNYGKICHAEPEMCKNAVQIALLPQLCKYCRMLPKNFPTSHFCLARMNCETCVKDGKDGKDEKDEKDEKDKKRL